MHPENNSSYQAFTFAVILGNLAPNHAKALGFLKTAEALAAGLTMEVVTKALVQAQVEVKSWKS